MTEKQETKAITPFEEWITLEAAAKKLGCKRRTVERYIQAGMIHARPGKPPGSRQMTRIVDPVAIAKLKHDLRTGEIQIHWDKAIPSPTEPGSTAVSRPISAGLRRVPQHDATTAQVATLVGISCDPWLTIEEAATYVRLPAAYLRRCVASGELLARNVLNSTAHSWRIKRSAVDALPERANYRTPVIDRDVALGIVSGD